MPTFVAHYCSPHPTPREPYRDYLEQRWQQGEVMIKTLWRELQAQGFRGSYKSVWNFVRTWPLPAGMTPTSSSSSSASATRRQAATTPTPRTRQMAVVAREGGSECKGWCLSAGFVPSFPTPFVSGSTGSGFCAPDSGAKKPGFASPLWRGPKPVRLRKCGALPRAWRKSYKPFKRPSPSPGVRDKSKGRLPD